MKYWCRGREEEKMGYLPEMVRLLILLLVLTSLATSVLMHSNLDMKIMYALSPMQKEESLVYVSAFGRISSRKVLRHWRFGELHVYKLSASREEILEFARRGYKIFSGGGVTLTAVASPYTVFMNPANAGDTDVKQYHRRTERFTGKGVTICIVDTGIDYLHPDFFRDGESVIKCMVSMFFVSETGRYLEFIPGVNGTLDDAWSIDRNLYARYGTYAWMDENGHGTHVAGIIAGQGNVGVKGLATGVSLVIVRAFDRTGSASLDICLEALEWIYNNTQRFRIRIVNLSWGSVGDSKGVDPLSVAIDYMSRKLGLIFVVAAGNEGNMPFTITIPACARYALAVGAFDPRNMRIANFSSIGPTNDLRLKPDFLGAGVLILSTKPITVKSVLETLHPELAYNEYYMYLSGTSMATPCVSAVLACTIEKLSYENVKPSHSAVIREVIKSCERIAPFRDFVSGYGIPLIKE